MTWEKELRKIYKDLDRELSALSLSCRACGKCCHFDEYGHKLYVSDIEIDYILNNLGPPKTAVNKCVCPYLADNKCTIREYRPLGCRIFYCQEGWDTSSYDLYEKYLRRIKDLYTANGLEWNYASMPNLLDESTCRSPYVA